MLHITVPASELWDEKHNEFVYIKEQHLALEHSLVSLSKWESKWHKPFLSPKKKTVEENIDYVRCMTLTQNVDPNVYFSLTNENIAAINDYIESPMTATVIKERRKGNTNGQLLTSELIYYYMIEHGIPVEFQKWHLNRLMTLIRICDIKSRKPKKMSASEAARERAALNAARRNKYKTRG